MATQSIEALPREAAFAIFSSCATVISFRVSGTGATRAVYGLDLVIGIGLLGMLGGLAIAHFRARADYRRIRELIRAEEDRSSLGPSRSSEL